MAWAGGAVARAKAWLIQRQMQRYVLRLPPPRMLAQRHPGRRFTAPIAAAAAAAPAPAALPLLPRAAAPDALVGLGMPECVAMIPPPGQGVVQTMACLPSHSFPDLFVFGQVAAAHALSEQYARGARPWTALAIASMPGDPSDDRVQADLADMLAGAEALLAAEGWALAGGQARAAAELSLGFAVSGLIDPAQLPRRRRLRPDDALLLTKPLGSGIVLAGHARGEARAAWIRTAADVMRTSNATAARILRAHGMSACAAVNGAGLGGHLGDLLRAAGMAAVLWPESVPLLPGTLELLTAGRPEQRRGGGLPVPHGGDGGTFAALLADPQISGGLVAGVAPARAEACLSALRAEGLQAAVIGVVEAAADGGPLIRLERR